MQRVCADVGSKARSCQNRRRRLLLMTQTESLCPLCHPSSSTPLLFLCFSHPCLLEPTFSFLPPPQLYPFPLRLLFPMYPSSSPSFLSPLLARWLVYPWDGCRIKATSFFFFFFYLHRSFSASLPSLILVSSHCGVFNAGYHMVADSSWRCWGAFIHALKHSCNNACQGSDFFITLMLALADPSNPSTTPTNKPAQLLSPSLNT